MIEIYGKHNRALCFTDLLESGAYGQILAVCNREEFADCKIRIMPDVHEGKGCTIGTTVTVTDKVVPGMVGVDIGCGMETVRIAEKEVDFAALDALIREKIPCGAAIRTARHPYASRLNLPDLRCFSRVKADCAERSVGTLGGGNHFIEMDWDEEGNLYLVIHSGSRHLGVEVADYYQNEGRKALWGGAEYQIRETVAQLKAQGRSGEIEATVAELRRNRWVDLPEDLCYVQGKLFEDYIHDMKIVQRFADLNRAAMADLLIEGMGFTVEERFTTVHNYIDTESMILRKGAVSAKKGEKLLIPINMRDGSLICEGKGNEDWNFSAPHGAGRLLSRSDAKRELSLEEYEEEMKGIYTSCVNFSTLDESPMAYKSMDHILAHIEPTARVLARIRPVYNFKASVPEGGKTVGAL